ncbi:hypothetical protein [Myceligenerans pegani]|uniref:RNA polymerase sigma-70 region 4 domain-containing protein n=1 Tax=Myceligenerans pegani TaxID=2776917 RepID=A0ABR9N230_9MICO|nr:hypothetical protein [Myceligenerans sp. TRM 65318]MBE1877405.1 hypothetical protein [Myceligenerans sp. TRM 65318]MBE3019676.1 hypothetical protein [Myceligenerans sp. TRM 65318]
MPNEKNGSKGPGPSGRSLTERLAGALAELSDDEYYVLRSRALARRPTSYANLAGELGVAADDVVDLERRATTRIAGASRGPDHDALAEAMSQQNSTVALATLLPEHPVLTETVPRTNLPVWAFLVQTLGLDDAAGTAQAGKTPGGTTPDGPGGTTRDGTAANGAAAGGTASDGTPPADAAPRTAARPTTTAPSTAPLSGSASRATFPRPAAPPRPRGSVGAVRPAWTAWFPWLITLGLAGDGRKTSSWDFEPQVRGRLRHQVNALTSIVIDQLPAAPVGVMFPAIAHTDTMADLDIPASHAERFAEKGIRTFGDLTGRTVAELRFLPHYGAKTLSALVQRMVYRSLQHPAPAGSPAPPSLDELERPLDERIGSTLGFLDERARTILTARRFTDPQVRLPELAERFEISNMHAQQIDSRSASLVRSTLISPSLLAAVDEHLPAPDGAMSIDDLVARIPVLGAVVPAAENQPAWRVLDGLGGLFEVTDGEARRASSNRKRSANPPVPGRRTA